MQELDGFELDFVEEYEPWLKEKKVRYPTKVIPVGQSVSSMQQVVPLPRVEDLIMAADPIGVTDCVCRAEYQNCDNPVRVCLVFNSSAEKKIRTGKADSLSKQEALEIIKDADEKGLIHLTYYKPGQEICSLCSCCSCCCVGFRLMKKHNITWFTVKSDYIARDEADRCTSCFECVDRCYYDARKQVDGKMVYEPDQCYGCGLCVSSCPEDVIQLEPR